MILVYDKILNISLGCDLFMQCVSQLVRDSREFSTLLGRMEPGTGVRRPGAIDKVRPPYRPGFP